MSEADIEETEKMCMYSEELENTTVLRLCQTKRIPYDSSSDVSEQKVSLYDSSSERVEVKFQNKKHSHDSSSEGESPNVVRVPYDSSSEIASETEMDYSLGSESEREESEGNVPYDSGSDIDSI